MSKRWCLDSFKGKNVNFYITDYGKLSKNAEKMEEGLNDRWLYEKTC